MMLLWLELLKDEDVFMHIEHLMCGHNRQEVFNTSRKGEEYELDFRQRPVTPSVVYPFELTKIFSFANGK